MTRLVCTTCGEPWEKPGKPKPEDLRCSCGGTRTTPMMARRHELKRVSDKRMEAEGDKLAAVPYGYCHCGCGQKTRIAPQTARSKGWVKGEPVRFLPYHAARLAGLGRAEQLRRAGGIPEDAPVDAQGNRCEAKVCPICGEEFLAKWSQRKRRKACSPKCAGQLRRAALKARRGKSNPNYKSGARTDVRDREGERRWYAGAQGWCQHPACPGTERRLDLHHVVYAQHVVRAGGDKWDPRNSLTLCRHCHSSHHQRGSQVVPVSALRDETIVFAVELLGTAAEGYFRRYYRGDDPRLDRLEEFGLTEAGRLAA